MTRMKFLLSLLLLTLPVLLWGQTTVTKSVATRAEQPVTMTFTYPEQIKVEVWDKETVEVEANVSINRGENDDAFRINVDETGNALAISTEIVDRDELPERIMIHHGGQDHYFNTSDWSDPNVQAFLDQHGKENIQWTSHGPLIDILVKVFVPKNVDLKITSKFGLIEMKGITRSLTMDAKHGGLDLAVPSTTSGLAFEVACDWGEVYTDLDLDIVSSGEGRMLKDQQFTATLNGGGQPVRLISKHGNIYLRAL